MRTGELILYYLRIQVEATFSNKYELECIKTYKLLI